MNNQTIADIYQTNDKIRRELIETISNLPDERANFLPDGEKWTVAQFVEHLSMVEDGMTKISGKLLAEAQSSGNKADGKAVFSESFMKKAAEMQDMKFESPDRVRPTGTKTVAESLEKMRETREQLEKLRPLFETVECSDARFPHPFMGDLTAHEWLALVGGHEARHLAQIKNLIEKLPG
ncbi:MAG: DinB family protein [Acidobacteriota bacterium]|nr:DinB family protein [Acidobacteriota bacterium]